MELSRRKFIQISGGAAALTALATLGGDWQENIASANLLSIPDESYTTDVLVIGGGMAGLFAAVKAHDAGARVMMVSKGRLGSSGQTPFAKGIFAYDAKSSKVTIDDFLSQVAASSLGTNNPVFTRQLAEHSLERVKELREWGFFESPIYNEAFSKPINERNIPLIERVMITCLIKQNEAIAGAAGFSLDGEKVVTINAKSVILCTGAGGFKPNGFPIGDLTHDGSVMAYKIGAKITGKEWNDGHPAQSKNPAASFDSWHDMFEKKPETTTVQINHHLGVDLNYMAYTNGNPVSMGPPGSGQKVVGGPYVPEAFREQGRRPPSGDRDGGPPGGERRGPPQGEEGHRPPGFGISPVGGSSAGLAIHKSEGLTPINEQCESTVKGLYAAGDALGSHMSGGIYTQIGSSLSGSAVQGSIAGEAAALYAKKIIMPNIPETERNAIEEQILAPLKRKAGYSPAWVTQTLQGIMIPNFVLYIKKESMMQAALAYIEELRDHHMPMLRAADMHELRLAHETENMIISAEMKLRASIMRRESRCSHYRLDYPDVDIENWQAWINIYQDGNGNMQLEKQPFESWSQKTKKV